VSGVPTRVFIARLAGTPLFDPIGDQVGRVRDVVVTLRAVGEEPRALGLVVEVPGRRRIFLPMTRVTTIDSGQVITTGLVNMRRFQQRPAETLVLGEMLDRTVALVEDGAPVVVEDVGMEQQRNRDWTITRVFVRRPGKGLRRRGESLTVEWRYVAGFGVEEYGQGAANLLATFEKLNPPDLATVLHELSSKRRIVVEQGARVSAKVSAEQIAIFGEVNGEVICSGRVEIAPNGRVTGEISAGSLVMQEGGFFEGSLKMLNKGGQTEGS